MDTERQPPNIDAPPPRFSQNFWVSQPVHSHTQRGKQTSTDFTGTLFSFISHLGQGRCRLLCADKSHAPCQGDLPGDLKHVSSKVGRLQGCSLTLPPKELPMAITTRPSRNNIANKTLATWIQIGQHWRRSMARSW